MKLWMGGNTPGTLPRAMLTVVLFIGFTAGGAFGLDIRATYDIQDLGDIAVTFDFKGSPEEYTQLRRDMPSAEMFVKQMMGVDAQTGEVRDISAHYDDDFYQIHIEMVILGAVINQGHYWSWKIGNENEKIRAISLDDARAVFESIAHDGDQVTRTDMAVRLPPGATGSAFNAQRGELTYQLAAKTYEGEIAHIDCTVRHRKQVMTAIYKQYGSEAFPDLWLSKVLFTNTGEVPLKDFRVKFSLGDYSDGWSEAYESAVVLPGQHVVETYRPILTEKCARLKSATPAKLRVHYSYRTPSGQHKTHELIRRVLFLGHQEFIFSSLPATAVRTFSDAYNNSDFLAAWVTSEDPVVSQFGAMANEFAKGAGANTSNSSAAMVAAAIYELMRVNRITYQSPAGLFNSDATQLLKFPRDTLRDRSGTCIDLAIAFAAFAQAQGLNPVLVLVPEHCFPAIYLPENGNLLPIEMTGLGGGTADSSATFDKAVELATDTMVASMDNQRIIIINLSEARKKGIYPPELPVLPADILAKWGVRRIETAAAATPEPTPAAPRAAAQPEPPPPAAQAPAYRTWQHPQGYFSVEVPEVLTPEVEDYVTVFESDASDFHIRIYTLPVRVKDQTVDESAIAGVFLKTCGVDVSDNSEISEAEEVSADTGFPSLGRTYALHDNDGLRMRSVSIYAATQAQRYLFVFSIAGHFLEQEENSFITDVVEHVTHSIRFQDPLTPPSGEASGKRSKGHKNTSGPRAQEAN